MENTQRQRISLKSAWMVFSMIVVIALALAGCPPVDTPVNVAVTGVSVSPTTASIDVGGTQQLTATVEPSSATNPAVTWSTSEANCATVSSSGLATGMAAGSVTITVETADGGKTATCAVTVTEPTHALAWTTVFLDNFNRADTTGRDLGADWTTIGSGTDEITILNNQVHSVFTTIGGPGAGAVYNGGVDYAKPLRVSVRGMITVGGAESPEEFVGLEINTQITYEGYYTALVYDSGTENLFLKLARTDGANDVASPSPATYDVTGLVGPGNWYIFEIETSGSTITARIKNSTGTTTIGTVSITDPTLISGGAVVFYNYIVDDTQMPMSGYTADFDDFLIESYQ
jgi:hypothetical protein